jgi:hypothetical protein
MVLARGLVPQVPVEEGGGPFAGEGVALLGGRFRPQLYAVAASRKATKGSASGLGRSPV